VLGQVELPLLVQIHAPNPAGGPKTRDPGGPGLALRDPLVCYLL